MESRINYCQDSSCNHSITTTYPKCVVPIKDVIHSNINQVSGLCVINPVISDRRKIFNLDKVEKIFCKQFNANKHYRSNKIQMSKSMDMGFAAIDSIGISVVFAELKLNVKNADNIDPTELKEKCNGSTKHFADSRILGIYYFAYSDDIIDNAQRIFTNLIRAERLSIKYKAITLTDLYNLHFLQQ